MPARGEQRCEHQHRGGDVDQPGLVQPQQPGVVVAAGHCGHGDDAAVVGGCVRAGDAAEKDGEDGYQAQRTAQSTPVPVRRGLHAEPTAGR
jgi:hypothetical protein